MLRFLVLLSLLALAGCFNTSNYVVEKKYFQARCNLHEIEIPRPFYKKPHFINGEKGEKKVKIFDDKGQKIASDKLGFAFNEKHKDAKQRKIAIFIDGTGMSGNKKNTTNIRKMYNSAVEQACHNSIIPYYNKGLGTSFGKMIRGRLMGEGIDDHIKDTYRFLVNTYQDGDQIYLFGFSRGAYTVRALNGLIEFAGLLQFKDKLSENKINKNTYQLIDNAIDVIYTAYNKDNDGRQTFEHRLRHCIKKAHNATNMEEIDNNCISKKLSSFDFKEIENKNTTFTLKKVKVEGVGVFDTVPALGIRRDDFPDNYRVGLYANKTFHAMSLDEQRHDFRVLRFSKKEKSTDNLEKFKSLKNMQFLKEVWFAGDHSDVGGGNGCSNGLEKISRDWMLHNFKDDELFKAGYISASEHLECNTNYEISNINNITKDDYQYEEGILHDQFLTNGILGWVYGRSGLHWRTPKVNDTLHGSIMCRLALKKLPVSHKEREHTGRYQPTNLYLKPSEGKESSWFKGLEQYYDTVGYKCLKDKKKAHSSY